MATDLVSYTIPNLSNGVSQQPPALRLSSSCEDQVNAWNSVVSGLMKRPGTQHVGTISGGVGATAAGHIINRDTGYQYLVVAAQDGIRVFDAQTGAEQTVTFPYGKSYLNQASSPVDSFRFLTIGDTTFVLNRDVVVQPWAYGEQGQSGGWSPTGTVATTSLLPSSPTLGWVYYVSTEGVYYRYETVGGTPAVTTWSQTYGPADTPPSGYTLVASLPATVTIGQKIYTTTTETYSSQVWVDTSFMNDHGSSGYWQTQTVNVTKYTGYTGTSSGGTASSNQWVKRQLNEVWSGAPYTGRRNPASLGTLFVTNSAANTYYTVYVNGVQKASFLTAVGVDAATSVQSTGVIASNLVSQLTASGYTCEQYGSTILITNLSAGDTLSTLSGGGDRYLKHYRDAVQAFTDLPPHESNGRIVKVQGDADTGQDDYYVVFTNGTWVETCAWNSQASFQPHTMPHKLVRNSDGTWTFTRHSWVPRNAGDATSNADPSFVGEKINDIFAFANRLCFLADENVIMSEANNYENFYRTTLATLVDSDRLDYAVLSNNVDIMRHAIPFNKDLLLFSDRNQFRFKYTQYLGPKNVEIQYTTSFSVSPRIKPVNMGGSVYFLDDKPSYKFAKVYEYFPREDLAGGDDADEVSSQVPEYIPTGVRFMAANARMKLSVLGSFNRTNSLYVYKFFWAGDKKIQNAWGRWEFPEATNIHWAGFLENYLYLIIQRPNGTYIERMRVDEDVFTTIPQYTVYLDRMIPKSSLSGLSYDAVAKKTTFTMPFAIGNSLIPEVVSNFVVMDSGQDVGAKAYRHTVERVSSTVFKVDGDITGSTTTCTVGLSYLFSYEFSKQYMKQKTRTGETIILNGRLQLRYIALEYHNTVSFQVTLKRKGATDITQQFSGAQIGGGDAILGTAAFSTGVFRIPVMGNAQDTIVTITNDSPYGHAFGSAEWTALFVPRAKPI